MHARMLGFGVGLFCGVLAARQFLCEYPTVNDLLAQRLSSLHHWTVDRVPTADDPILIVRNELTGETIIGIVGDDHLDVSAFRELEVGSWTSFTYSQAQRRSGNHPNKEGSRALYLVTPCHSDR